MFECPVSLKRLVSLAFCLMLFTCANSQFAPPAGKPGSTAVYKDSSAFSGWASTCSITRGFIDFTDSSVYYNGSNKTTYGSYLYGSGPPDEFVISLGDHGSAVLGFDVPIGDGTGPDFAVFENSFGDAFLELAFVEVSSDGTHFVRFPAVSLTPEIQQVNTFDTLDATRIHNFAGKYRHSYGTPFDLADIKDSAGINIHNVTHVRIQDVGGCVMEGFAVYDSQMHKVNDPWPTPFDTGGFDLDAIGVINYATQIGDIDPAVMVKLYPNPVIHELVVSCLAKEDIRITLSDLSGRTFYDAFTAPTATIDLSSCPAGMYVARIITADGHSITRKFLKGIPAK